MTLAALHRHRDHIAERQAQNRAEVLILAQEIEHKTYLHRCGMETESRLRAELERTDRAIEALARSVPMVAAVGVTP